ncbi:MAG: hypothetical protein AAF467_20980 [Actinomycetota bacterium]
MAQTIVETLGGDEFRASGWTPEIIRAPGFSLYIELDPEQYHVLDEAVVACVDTVDLAWRAVGLNVERLDRACFGAALGPDADEKVLMSFPSSPSFDRGRALAAAALECVNEVDFVAIQWALVARSYTADDRDREFNPGTVDRECVATWLVIDGERTRTLTVFEFVQLFQWRDDRSEPLATQVDDLNQLLVSGEVTRGQLDELHRCFGS